MILFFLPITLPPTLTGMIKTLASMNGPLAMIVLGIYLAQIPLKSLFTEGVIYRCALVRLIIIPTLTIVLMMLFPAKYHIIKLTVLIAASAPVGSNVAIFAQLYNKDYTRAVKEVCLSTLLCIVTMPILIGIAIYIL
jgi:predicted permease